MASDDLIADVRALAAMTRSSAARGERESADWIAGRLRDAGVADVRVDPYRGQTTYAWVFAAHLVLSLIGARTRSRVIGIAALFLAEGELSGRRAWIRRLLPKGRGANVIARIPATGEGPHRTLVLVAHHDAARTGLIWSPRLVKLAGSRRLANQAMDPFALPFAPFIALAPVRRARPVVTAGLLGALALIIDVARSPTVPGASDNATGVAALLEIARRSLAAPRPDTEVLLAFTGGEEAGMDGMRAFLAAHALDPETTLVLGLDTLGAGVPIVATAEGALVATRYAPRDLALVPPDVERWRLGGWTDPVLARHAGLRTLSVLSRGPDGGFTNYHLPTDTPERVDWDSVDACLAATESTLDAWAADV